MDTGELLYKTNKNESDEVQDELGKIVETLKNKMETSIVEDKMENIKEVCECKKEKFNPSEQLIGDSVVYYESESTTGIYNALLEFHKNFETVEKSSENPFHESKYADLSAILNIVRPILAKEGLILMQFAINGTKKDSITIKTKLIHVPTGEFIETDTVSITPPKLDAQSYGSLETYLRRYSLQAILMVSFKCDDKDASDIIDDTPTRVTASKKTSGKRSL